MLSSLPKISANIQLLDDFFSNTTLEFDVIYKQVTQDELAEADVEKLLEDATQMVNLNCETAKELRARLLQAATAINEEEPKGEKKREPVETEFTPKMVASFLPGKQYTPHSFPPQVAHYAGGKPKEYDEVATHKPDSLNRLCPEEDHLQNVMNKAVQLDVLHKLKNSLREIESRMSEERK